MQSTHLLDDAGWGRLIQDAAYYFDDLALKRGFQYYKQKRVSGLAAVPPGLVTAFVDGTERYNVEIILRAISISSCTCPVLGPCKHMAAVLMDYAGTQGRPVQQLANAKSSAQARAAMNSARPVPGAGNADGGAGSRSGMGSGANRTGYAGGADRKGEATGGFLHGSRESLRERGRLIPVMNVAQWHELFAHCVSALAGDTRNPRYVDEALTAILRIKPPLTPELDKLFSLHARLFVLETLTNRSGGREGAFAPSLGYYTHIAVTELQDEIERGFHTELPLASEPEQWNRIMDTLDYLRQELLAESREHNFYSALYYLLWRKWIIPEMQGRTLFKEELRRLEREEEQRTDAPPLQALLTARAWMHFLQSEDDKALSLLREAAGRPGFHPERLDMFWEPLAEVGEPQRLVDWLTETGELLAGHRRHGLESYARYWEEAVRLLPESEPQMWNELTGMLPLSGDIYEEKLLERGRWREWMDYQLSSGKDPADFRVRELQPLEKHAPELLLPFYHQAVERYVSEKNRSSYKAAVKLLKRLNKLYKKLKAEERFERFLESFTTRHSRLRALQEELRKGKLTS
ncbi:SWIM zinc finger family protein [Paenibacillus rhizophilus]|uniref:SWIM-type domain-containing protein n=1 Tax=Paenibacillus rhizophilus TaxID=1850366 RepID=A0A3N9P734_9BACL|nr:SWIM zinc finger family protein [Paenibacillus rhizophilus]RQW10884.1 hypothetical protein EH198_14110 [Paenibacillus rhizophilus]